MHVNTMTMSKAIYHSVLFYDLVCCIVLGANCLEVNTFSGICCVVLGKYTAYDCNMSLCKQESCT